MGSGRLFEASGSIVKQDAVKVGSANEKGLERLSLDP